MGITLKDIAAETGYSLSTVSRVINGDCKKMSSATSAKILDIANSLGYIKSTKLSGDDSSGQVKSIAIILASNDKSFQHPFFSEMLSHLQLQLQKTNYALSCVASACAMSQESFERTLAKQKLDGAIILGRFDHAFLQYLKTTIPHIVYTGVNFVGHETDEVICNGYQAIKTIYTHFWDLGYRRIGYVGPIQIVSSEGKNEYHRYASYVACCHQSDSPVNSDYICQANDTEQEGFEAMKKMILSGTLPEAIICAADSVAIGVIRAAYHYGVNIPQDVAIAAIDNIAVSAYLCPSLTTINVPKEELSRLSINMLIDRIENHRENNVRLDVPYDLIIRESCGHALQQTFSR